jgi:hypothetical protein
MTRAMRLGLGSVVCVLVVSLALVVLVAGCGSHRKSARRKASGAPAVGVDVFAAKAGQLLNGRRLAFSFGSADATGVDITDLLVLERGRVVNVTKRLREDSGADQAEPFSLSPNGEYIAFFLQTIVRGACGDCQPVLYVMRSDGSHAHELGANLGFVGFSSTWAPSWDRNGRSFVVAAPKTGIDPNESTAEFNSLSDDDTGLFRFDVPSGKEKELTRPAVDRYDYAQPEVSPDGREIAYLRSASPEPSDFWQLASPGIISYVYIMQANGRAEMRLPLPPRPYGDLWWCGNSSLCVDSPTKKLAASENTYRLNLRTDRITHLRRWPEATYVETGFLSPTARFAIGQRKTARGAEVFAGPVNAAGVATFAPVLAASSVTGDPFFGFSASGR